MTAEFSRVRRFAIAGAALLCAAILFRAQVADALVIRGDDYMFRGDHLQALERYRRALLIAPSSEVAADRYVLISLQRQTRASLQLAVGVATRYLERNPSDAAVLSDRALCYLHMRRFDAAERDFAQAARAGHSVNDYVFAGWAASHAGHERSALSLWRQALRIRPHYGPALIALRTHPR